MNLQVLISNSFDPWFNLATEEWIYNEMDPSQITLFIWRNQNTVVIGRNQNPWSECNLTQMDEEKVKLARRTTGGGAVYQDLGNTCFTFLSPKESYSRKRNLGIVIRALAKFGIQAESSGRNDLVVPFADGPRKISGSAFRESRDRAFHHGTLLINTDLTQLSRLLTPNPKKLQSKGMASVRSRVANLTEINANMSHEQIQAALIEEFEQEYLSNDFKKEFAFPKKIEIQFLDPLKLAEYPEIEKRYRELSSWDWRFGRAPEFTQKMSQYFSWGFVEVFLNANNGVIETAQIFSDSLYPEFIEVYSQMLQQKTYCKQGIFETRVSVLDHFFKLSEGSAPDHVQKFEQEAHELTDWLAREVEVNESPYSDLLQSGY